MLSWLQNLDHWLLIFINQEATCSFFDWIFVNITDLHKLLAFKIAILPLTFLLFYKKFKFVSFKILLFLILAIGLSDLVGGKIKNLVERPRPEYNSEITVQKRTDAGSFSFYSNHAANMFTFASFAVFFVPEFQIPLYFLAGLVAYSRIYNGVHYPSDVLVGIFVGLFWGMFFSRRVGSFLKLKYHRKGMTK